MLTKIFAGLLLYVVAVRGDEKCCQGNICYNNNPPFNGIPLPNCGETLNIDMKMYTRSNRNTGQTVSRTVIPAAFSNSRQTIFYTHGWLGSSNNNWLHDMKDDTLTKGDYNVVIVGWQESSQNIWYPQSAADTRSVGTEIGLVARNLVQNGGLSRTRTYCVGHSLGGHVCGHAGNFFKFGRITGMDPAGPMFENRDWACGLNPGSADLVDVLHTNGQANIVLNLGTMKVLGHVDFYPNGGGSQPECILDPLTVDTSESIKADLMPACSHMRAIFYFLESILTPCFNSKQRCTDPNRLPGSCATSINVIQTMGFDSSTYTERGIFYLTTRGSEPYCMG
jgi:pancreatic lipase-related protein 1/phosphatidic acid-selective phospholipase A1